MATMIQLETIDFSKNLLRKIPIELSECINLNEALFNDNYITEIPVKIIILPKLEVFEADRKYYFCFVLKISDKSFIT